MLKTHRVKRQDSLSKGIMMFKHYEHGDFVDYFDIYETIHKSVISKSDAMFYNATTATDSIITTIGGINDFNFSETENFSFYCEFKKLSDPSGSDIDYQFGRGTTNGSSPEDGFTIALYLDSIFIQIGGSNTTLGNEIYIIDSDIISYGDKYKVAGVVNRLTEELELFINGVFIDGVDITGIGSIGGEDSVSLGGRDFDSTVRQAINGHIYEGIIYNRVLTKVEAELLTSPEYSLLEPVEISIKQSVLMALYPDDGKPIAVNDVFEVESGPTYNVLDNDNYGCP